MIFLWLEKYAVIFLGAGVVVCTVGLGVQQWKLAKERASHAKDNAAFAARALKSEQDKDAAENRYRTESAKAQEESDAKQAAIDALIKSLADKQNALNAAQGKLAGAQKRIADLALDFNRVQRDLASYASGGADDTAPACEGRARRLAELLATSVDLVTESGKLGAEAGGLVREGGELAQGSAGSAETYRNALNHCVAAWPQ